MFQQTPRTVILAPPSDEIVPPLLAVVCARDVADVVVSVGITALAVVKLTAEPYAVPELFVAYART